jgi:hypothetical protein
VRIFESDNLIVSAKVEASGSAFRTAVRYPRDAATLAKGTRRRHRSRYSSCAHRHTVSIGLHGVTRPGIGASFSAQRYLSAQCIR